MDDFKYLLIRWLESYESTLPDGTEDPIFGLRPINVLCNRLYKYDIIKERNIYFIAIIYLNRILNAGILYTARTDDSNFPYTEISCINKVPKSANYPAITFTRQNFRLIWYCCVMIGSKTIEDDSYNNDSFAQLANIHTHIINKWELMILQTIRFNVIVTMDEIEKIKEEFAEAVAGL